MNRSLDSRGRRVATAVVALLVLTASAPAEGVGRAPAGETNSGWQSGDNSGWQSDETNAVATQTAPPDAALLTAAREGVERAIADAGAEGIAVSPSQRQAATQGVELGVALASNQSTVGEVAPAGQRPGTVTAETVRLAAYGAAFGALRAANRRGANDSVVQSATTGGLLGSVTATATVGVEGGELTDEQIRLAALGSAEGTADAVGRITANETLRAGAGHVTFAAAGGAGGALAAAGLLPIFGQQAAPETVYVTAFGSAAGAMTGTHVHSATLPLPITAVQTFSAAAGAAGGAVSATVVNPDLPPPVLFEGAWRAANETLGRTDLAPNQYAEAAVTASIDALTTFPEGDAVFPEPLRLGSFLAVTPRDADGDGRYEDVNGNLVLSYDDVIMLSVLLDSDVELTPDQRRAFDFNEDGVVDARDVLALDVEITGGPYADNRTANDSVSVNDSLPVNNSAPTNDSERTGTASAK